MTEQTARNIATLFLKQWLNDRCPAIDPQILNLMLELVDERLKEECLRRQAAWGVRK